MVKLYSVDAATDDSLVRFIDKLFNQDNPVLWDKVSTLWGTVTNSGLEETAAHRALAKLKNLLETQQKKVFVYTDNIDGIHGKCGIELSRSTTWEGISVGEYNSKYNALWLEKPDIEKKS